MKDLFGLSVSEVSDHGQLAQFLEGFFMVRQNIMAGRRWWSKVVHFMVNRRQREQEKEKREQDTLFMVTLLVTYILQLGPASSAHSAMNSSMD
jgi:hypothetical protein